MGANYNNLDELRRKKALLKTEVNDLQDLITFSNTKESLSVITHGFTDKFLQEDQTPEGETKVSLKKNEIVKGISNHLKDSILNKDAVLGFAKSDAGANVFENTLKVAAVSLIGNYAKKNIKNSSWKKKFIGLAIIYLAPIALRFIKNKIEDYQKSQTTSSFEQLI